MSLAVFLSGEVLPLAKNACFISHLNLSTVSFQQYVFIMSSFAGLKKSVLDGFPPPLNNSPLTSFW